eukprot:TRINITY_DN12503_c0_g1_i1.p1 TRINITY_DN12503_c0_g1~~TRINITY_DN12503_c0_g1_i1.p1  ORF type:complete len:106 (+),score=12.81 TRINITY_DN12503_c0_g1_i1:52-369(+)
MNLRPKSTGCCGVTLRKTLSSYAAYFATMHGRDLRLHSPSGSMEHSITIRKTSCIVAEHIYSSFCISIDRSTVLAFPTELERDGWLEKLHDAQVIGRFLNFNWRL